MSDTAPVRASVELPVAPAVAFDIFTREIDDWYLKNRHTLFESDRARALVFEPFAGGRLLEVYDAGGHDYRELASIEVWEHGHRLVFVDHHGSVVEVRFQPSPAGTRVELEHRGLENVPDASRRQVRQYGWTMVLPWFSDHMAKGCRSVEVNRRNLMTVEQRELVTLQGVSPYLYYEDAAAAIEWLERVFGFREDIRYVDADGVVQEAEMLVGETRLMIGGKAPAADEGPGQLFIVNVDDVDALHHRVRSAGVEADEPVEMPYGPKTFTVRDPWGYRWSFWQMVKHDIELPDGWQEIRR